MWQKSRWIERRTPHLTNKIRALKLLHRRSLILCAPDILRSLTNKLQSLLPILEVLRLPVLITRLFLNSFVFVLLALLWTFLSETNDLPETQVKKEFLALLLRNKCFSIFQLCLFKPLFYKLSNIPNGLNSLGFFTTNVLLISGGLFCHNFRGVAF